MIGPVVDSLLRQNVEFQYSAMFLLRVGACPELLYDCYSEIRAVGMLEKFLSGAYVLSPYYNALTEGSLRKFSTLAETSFSDALQDTWSSGSVVHPHVSLVPGALTDEVCFAHVGENSAVIYLAMRSAKETAFSKREMADLRAASPVVQGLLSHALAMACGTLPLKTAPVETPPVGLITMPLDDDESLTTDRSIESFFTEMLSPREKSSIAMTLEGKSVFSIADDLGISPHTVRVHLRNAYGKLRVRNRLELVGMFVKRAGFKSQSAELVAGDA